MPRRTSLPPRWTLPTALARFAACWLLCALALSPAARAADDAGPAAAETAWAAPARDGMAQMARGHYDAAWPPLKRAAALAREALGERHAEVLSLRLRLGVAWLRAGRFDEAESELKTVLAQQREAAVDGATLGPTLSNLGVLYTQQGRYREAEPVHLESLALQRQALGAGHLELTRVHNNLGVLYRQMGRLPQAEEHLQRSLQLREQALGERHAEVGTALVNLGNLLRDRGDLERAEAAHRRALAVLEERLGPQHPQVATALNNLALVLVDGGDFKQAQALLARSLALRRQVLGPTHPEVAKSLGNLARALANQGDEAGALPLLAQALEIQQQQQRGRPHRDLAQTLRELADLHARRGEVAQALERYQRSARMLEDAFDDDHPELALVLAGMARLAWQQGGSAAAAPLLTRANDIEEHHLDAMLGQGSEAQRRAYAATLRTSTDFAVDLALHGGAAAPELARVAAQTVLRRKGRVLEAMGRSTQAWAQRLDAADRPLLQELADVRAERAAWLASTPPADDEAHRRRGRALRERQSALETQLSRVAAPFVVQAPEVRLAAVQAALPRGTALLEWVVYQPRLRNAAAPFMEGGLAQARPDPATRRYAAFVLQRTGNPAWIDLGRASVIDAAVATARRALANPLDPGWRPHARRLDALVFAPLRARVPPGVTSLLLAPDGALGLLPFAVLQPGPPLALQRHRLAYLGSGRELLRWAPPAAGGPATPSAGPGVIVAAPDFDAVLPPPASSLAPSLAPSPTPSPAPPPPPTAAAPADGAWRAFPDLPGTRQEAADVQRLLAGSRILSGRDATVQALQALRHPGVLHIATHGYTADRGGVAGQADHPAADAPAPPAVQPAARPSTQPPATHAATHHADHALLDSGLALAGANDTTRPGAGRLSALELAGLDLWGTHLVVLSACDSGLGLPLPGEGVFGLRHALGLAGSRSQVMSLWPVDDQATRVLMQGFYRALARGLGPAAALRDVQLRLMRRPAPHDHPFYWAGFVAAGADTPLPAHLLAPRDGQR